VPLYGTHNAAPNVGTTAAASRAIGASAFIGHGLRGVQIDRSVATKAPTGSWPAAGGHPEPFMTLGAWRFVRFDFRSADL
jgi:hypothetical protein